MSANIQVSSITSKTTLLNYLHLPCLRPSHHHCLMLRLCCRQTAQSNLYQAACWPLDYACQAFIRASHLRCKTDTCPACLPAADPIHLPHLIGPMKHYLWILKTTHGGADMDTCLEMAKGGLDGKPTSVTDHVHVCSYAVPV